MQQIFLIPANIIVHLQWRRIENSDLAGLLYGKPLSSFYQTICPLPNISRAGITVLIVE